MRMSFTFSKRHESLLRKLARRLDISMVDTLQRAIESLEEKEVGRIEIDSIIWGEIDHTIKGEGNKLENLTVVTGRGK